MARLVRDHARKLRFVAHPQKQPGKNDSEPAGEHHRVEVGDSKNVDPHILRGGPADLADQVANVAVDPAVLHHQIGTGDFLLHAAHLLPQALLVLVGRPEARADQRDHIGRFYPRIRDPRQSGRRQRPSGGEHRSAAEGAADAHQPCAFAFIALRMSWPGFIRPSNRSTICAAPSGVRMSPMLIPAT